MAPATNKTLARGSDGQVKLADSGRFTRAAATGWRGERMDYGIAIDSLLYRRRKAEAEQRAE
jgi:hypothetical protein